MNESEIIAKKSIDAFLWNFGSNAFKILLNIARVYVLGRYVSIHIFGIYGYANSTILLLSSFIIFGMSSAFLHRSEETKNQEEALATYFSLSTIFIVGWSVILLLVYNLIIKSPDATERLAFNVIILAQAITSFTSSQSLVLVRELKQKRLAIINLVASLLEVIFAILFALAGWGIWALMMTNISHALTYFGMLFLYDMPWRPRFGWNREIIRYYLRFGRAQTGSSFVTNAIDRVDDMWTKIYLGNFANGLYTQAHSLARYPAKLLEYPIGLVTAGTFTSLKNEDALLADAVNKVNALIIRFGVLIGGGLVFVAHEFILILLGEKWVEMVLIFQLMIVYTLLEPIKLSMANIFITVGRPEINLRIRMAQLGFLILGLFTVGNWVGLTGVAVIVDVMVLIGLGLSYFYARRYVKLSIYGPLIKPVSFAILTWFLAQNVVSPLMQNDILLDGIIKGVLYAGIYLMISLALDQKQLREMTRLFQKYIR